MLERLGLRLLVEPSAVDESPQPDEHPDVYVRRVAASKCAAAVAARAARNTPPDELPVLAADTTVVLGTSILGKPDDETQAAAMLTSLAGRRHEVVSAYHIHRSGREVARLVRTQVAFRLLAPEEIAAYVASGEWRGKAGGYAIQGIASVFVTEVRGSVTNVIGLPLAEVVADLRAVGALPGFPPAAFGVTEGIVASAEQALP